MGVFHLFSDGGGERSSVAAAAFIIDGFGEFFGGKRLRVAIPLGGATNNEAEILGGLLGLLTISLVQRAAKVVWYSDSEYTLKSASQYIKNWRVNGWRTSNRQAVKNIGLWKIYLEASEKLSITPVHVRGHSGHPENEECDGICTQLQTMQIQKQLIEGSCIARDGNAWTILPGHELIHLARNDDPDVESFIALMRGFVEGLFGPVGEGSMQKRSSVPEAKDTQLKLFE